ncbi:MAG: PspC domain-containing protein [Flavobacteriia bacterium]|nr:PspC domain-containing protein [Flavobacteriia bacterium]
MKKTVSVNIKGINFLIEEDAYELLQSYMKRLESSLKNEKGSKEIIEDIEYRISELCSQSLINSKQVVELEDIELIINTLGQPEEFIEGETAFTEEKIHEQTTNNTDSNNFDSKQGKRLFRDVENGKIAGVCSGISSYLNLDVIVVRVLFLVVFFLGGFSIPLYIILWIITPKVNTSIDRLRMQGKPITVDSVREEVEAAAHRFENETKSFANKIRNNDNISNRISTIGRLVAVIVGVGMVVVGVAILVFLVVFGFFDVQFIPAQTEFGFLSFSTLGELMIENDSDLFWMRLCAFIVGFSIVLFLFVLGAKLIFNSKSKWINLCLSSLFSIGLIGIIICIVFGVKTGRNMAIDGEIQRKILDINCENIQIEPKVSSKESKGEFVTKHESSEGFISIKGNKIKESGIQFRYKTSSDSLYHVYQEFSARSYTLQSALLKAKHIKHFVSYKDNVLIVSTGYSFPKSDKLRDQDVTIVIEIPSGKTVKMPHHTIFLGTNNSDEDINDPYYEEEGEMYFDGAYYHWN